MVQSTFEMWHEMVRLVENVIAPLTSRSVGLISDVNLKPHENRGSKRQYICFIVGAMLIFAETVYIRIPVWQILSKGFAKGTLTESTRPAVYTNF